MHASWVGKQDLDLTQNCCESESQNTRSGCLMVALASAHAKLVLMVTWNERKGAPELLNAAARIVQE